MLMEYILSDAEIDLYSLAIRNGGGLGIPIL